MSFRRECAVEATAILSSWSRRRRLFRRNWLVREVVRAIGLMRSVTCLSFVVQDHDAASAELRGFEPETLGAAGISTHLTVVQLPTGAWRFAKLRPYRRRRSRRMLGRVVDC